MSHQTYKNPSDVQAYPWTYGLADRYVNVLLGVWIHEINDLHTYGPTEVPIALQPTFYLPKRHLCLNKM